MGTIVYPFVASSEPFEMEDSEPYQSLSNRQEVKRIIARLDSLPAIPAVAAKVLNMLSEEEPDLDEVARLIEADQAIALKLLALVNSASSSSRVSSLARAMLVLGTSQIRYTLLSLTISDSIIKPLRKSSTAQQKASWKHCLACAVFCEMLAEAICPKLKAEAFVSGLVHDVGRLILEESVSDKYEEVLKAHSERGISIIEAEQEILDIDHTIVGKWLAEKWNLPDLIVEAIWLHHHPLGTLAELDFIKHRKIIAIVHLSSLLAHSLMADSGGLRPPEAGYEELAGFLGLKPKDIEKLTASVGRRYGERAAILELEGESEASFYFQSLQRANRKLAQMVAQTAHAKELETVVFDLQFIHELQLELARVEETEEVLLRTARSLINHFKREEGIVYYLDRPIKKISGIFWTEAKLSGSFSLDLDDELMPVRTNRTIFNDILDKLIRSYNSRFLRVSNGSHQLKMLQYYKPYLIIPMTASAEFIGEIIVYENRQGEAASLSKMDLKNYGYLASVASTSLARIGLNEKEKETAESLGRALLKNSQTVSEIMKIQKLESISTLAGGIAHDFNNILSAIIGNISLAKMYADSGGFEKVQARLEDADKASMRARDLTNQLLTFSKEGAPVKQVASIAEIIKDSASFVMSGSKSKCRFDIAKDLWPVDADIGQISQVINNLVINARQAMPNGGTIHLGAQNLTDPAISGALPCRGNYVKITVEDEGEGIAEENLHKIFDPYFTTKPTGHGLGLATSYSIISNHGGRIVAESKVGKGTVFSIFLPASCGSAKCEKNPAKTLPQIGGKILVMDDEESIRDIIKMMLDHSGCQTVFARDGTEAIDLFRKAKESAEPFDVVIMDLTIPGGMGGREALEQLMELDSEVHAIASSGYSKDPVIADFRKYGFRAAIAKPFKIEELYEAMKSCDRKQA